MNIETSSRNVWPFSLKNRHDRPSHNILLTNSFSCEHCDKVFLTSGNLKKHKVEHNFSSYCRPTFEQKSDLSKRQIIVTKTFLCDLCELSFKSLENLKIHTRKHIKDEPQVFSTSIDNNTVQKQKKTLIKFESNAETNYIDTVPRQTKYDNINMDDQMDYGDVNLLKIPIKYEDQDVNKINKSVEKSLCDKLDHEDEIQNKAQIKPDVQVENNYVDCNTVQLQNISGNRDLYAQLDYGEESSKKTHIKHEGQAGNTCMDFDTVQSRRLINHMDYEEQSIDNIDDPVAIDVEFKNDLESKKSKADILGGRKEKDEKAFDHHDSHSCNQCGYFAQSKTSLQKHILAVHEDMPHEDKERTNDLFTLCEECGYTGNGTSLLRHIKKVHTRIRYPCDKCNYQATVKGSLKRHTKTVHEGFKRMETISVYTCDYCGHKVATSTGLNLHKDSEHKNIKYNCTNEGCDYKAKVKGNLKLHIQNVHMQIKFPCEKCNYQATQKSSLKVHYDKIHKGIKYPCEFCEYQGTSKPSLQIHVDAMHNLIHYSCKNCNFVSKYKRTFKKHNKKCIEKQNKISKQQEYLQNI